MIRSNDHLFLSEVARVYGTHSLKEAEKIYLAVAQATLNLLKSQRQADWPDIGVLRVANYPSRRVHNAITNTIMVLPSMPVLRFKPDYKLKKYARNL
jgi:nucleoid DNA-binding protein